MGLIGITVLLILTAIAAVLIGYVYGHKFGKEMAETAVIDKVNHDPFAPSFEIVDVLYPHRAALMIEIPEDVRWKEKSGIVRRHWGMIETQEPRIERRDSGTLDYTNYN